MKPMMRLAYQFIAVILSFTFYMTCAQGQLCTGETDNFNQIRYGSFEDSASYHEFHDHNLHDPTDSGSVAYNCLIAEGLNCSATGDYAIYDSVGQFDANLPATDDGLKAYDGDKMLLINAHNEENTIAWSQTVQLVAGITYDFSAYVSLLQNNSPNVSEIRFEIANADTTITLSAITLTYTAPDWEHLTQTWEATFSGDARIQLLIVNDQVNGMGFINDFAIDNISFTGECPPDSGPAWSLPEDSVFCRLPTGGITLNSGISTAFNHSFNWFKNTEELGETGNEILIDQSGDYTLCFDSAGCQRSWNIKVEILPELQVNKELLAPSCFEQTDGQITLSTSGGKAPYSYLWNTGDTTQSLTQLADGTYTVEISYASFCTYTDTFMLDGPEQLQVDASITQAKCAGEPGAITLTVFGGTNPYNYAWSDTSLNTPNREALLPGNYTLTVSDSNDCEITESYQINEAPTQLQSTIDKQNPSCHGKTDGNIRISPTNGTPPYQYDWSTGANTATLFELGAGQYEVVISDANNCKDSIVVDLMNPEAPVTSATVNHPRCFGDSNGNISLNTTGGSSPYTYKWSDGVDGPERDSLSAGSYMVIIADDQACEDTLDINLENPEQLAGEAITINPVCEGVDNGSIELSVTGGIPPYSFTWSNGNTSNVLSNLGPGTYTIEIKDSAACTDSLNVDLSYQDSITLNAETTEATCGEANGSILLLISGGEPAYTITWDDTSINDIERKGLKAGIYTANVEDKNGCRQTTAIELNDNGKLTVEAIVTQPSCSGVDNGEIRLNVSDGAEPYTYVWYDDNGGDRREDLGPGDYSVTVKDSAGCQETKSFKLEWLSDEKLTITIVKSDPTCGHINGTINVQVDGGIPGYTYIWQDDSSLNVAYRDSLLNGWYDVSVVDSVGCVGNESAYLATGENLHVRTELIRDASCHDSKDAMALVTYSGGVEPYTISWDDGSNGDTLKNAGAYNYLVVVEDANGCSGFRTVNITSPKVIEAVYNELRRPDCNTSNGIIDVEGWGGTGALSYSWVDAPEVTSGRRENLPFDVYYFIAEDERGCIDTSQIILPPLFQNYAKVEIGFDDPICENNTMRIEVANAVHPGDAPLFQWRVNNNPVSDLAEEDFFYSDSLNKGDVVTVFMVSSDTCVVGQPISSPLVIETSCDEVQDLAILIPNVFTPNDDGLNDTWRISALEGEYAPLFQRVMIYNRWGQLIHHQDGGDYIPWDGRVQNGERISLGSYYFVLELDGGRSFSGSLTVLR